MTLRLASAKGLPGPVEFNMNGVKVRRIMQLTQDLSGRPFEGLQILDLGCGEGIYALEAGLRGATVTAIDGRTDRMSQGAEAARRLGLSTTVNFLKRDIRELNFSADAFDVIYFLGILYHLDKPNSFKVISSLLKVAPLLLIDTMIATSGDHTAHFGGKEYEGRKVREHQDHDTVAQKLARTMTSLDNNLSFYFTRQSLIAMLRDIGYPTVLECQAPLAPGQPKDRITLAAIRSSPVSVATYPWVNQMTEDELSATLRPKPPAALRKKRFRLGNHSAAHVAGLPKMAWRWVAPLMVTSGHASRCSQPADYQIHLFNFLGTHECAERLKNIFCAPKI